MKTVVFVAAVACLAVIFVEQSYAHIGGGGWVGNWGRCRQRPELNSTDVTCDRFQWPIGSAISCRATCLRCYRWHELSRAVSCLVNRRCVCLGRGDGESSTTTPSTAAPTSNLPSTTDGGEETTLPGGEETTTPSAGEETTVPVEETTVPGGEETTLPGGEETTLPGGEETTLPKGEATTMGEDVTDADE